VTKRLLSKTDKFVRELENKIEKQLDEKRPYWNNLISMYLREIAYKAGTKVANEVIDYFELDQLGWSKVERKEWAKYEHQKKR